MGSSCFGWGVFLFFMGGVSDKTARNAALFSFLFVLETVSVVCFFGTVLPSLRGLFREGLV